MTKYDEIFTKMNSNELRLRVPKTKKYERNGKYDRINELCTCDSNENNKTEQIHLELPCHISEKRGHKTYTSNLQYTINDKNNNNDRRVVNVTPTNCPLPVNMEKMIYPGKDVFILKIGKKLETTDKKTDLEIELITPQGPTNNNKVESNSIAQQCASANSLKLQSSQSSGKMKGRGNKKKNTKSRKEKGKSKRKNKTKN